MKKYCVTCTQIHNGYLYVQAESKEDAVDIASKHLDEVEWHFGERTADYAEEVDPKFDDTPDEEYLTD